MTPSAASVLIVGDGPVARALAAALTTSGKLPQGAAETSGKLPQDAAETSGKLPQGTAGEASGKLPQRWWRAQGRAIPAADVVVLAVSDRAIGDAAAEVLRAMAAPPVLLHCAGALPADEPFAGLAPRPAGVGLLHPLTSLATGAEPLDGVAFGVQGDDAGRAAALALVARMGGVPIELPDGAAALARYHAAAALVANGAVGLVDAGVELLATLGLDRARAGAALAALLASTARNLAAVGLPDALTGPIARGDAEVVERHLASLASDPAVAALYRATARRVVEVAADKGRAGAAALARIRALIGDGD